jgi:hypothetical protein
MRLNGGGTKRVTKVRTPRLSETTAHREVSVWHAHGRVARTMSHMCACAACRWCECMSMRLNGGCSRRGARVRSPAMTNLLGLPPQAAAPRQVSMRHAHEALCMRMQVSCSYLTHASAALVCLCAIDLARAGRQSSYAPHARAACLPARSSDLPLVKKYSGRPRHLVMRACHLSTAAARAGQQSTPLATTPCYIC